MISVRGSLRLKESEQIFPQETLAADKNSFAPDLNEKEVVELLRDLSNILGAFLIKQLFRSRLLDMR